MKWHSRILFLFAGAAALCTGCHKNEDLPAVAETPAAVTKTAALPNGKAVADQQYKELKKLFREAGLRAEKIVRSHQKSAGEESPEGIIDLPEDPHFEYFSEEQAIAIVQPLIDPSASFLSSYYDINVYEFFQPGDPEISRLGAIALRLKELEDMGYAIDTTGGHLWFQAAAAVQDPAQFMDIGDCALSALGIPANLIIGGARNLSRAALLQSARSLASRTIGWIGIGIAIYSFGDCMNWW